MFWTHFTRRRWRLLILWLAVGLIGLMCLFPPWIVFTEGYTNYSVDGKIDGRVVSNRQSIGYHYIFRPPSMIYRSSAALDALEQWFDLVSQRKQPLSADQQEMQTFLIGLTKPQSRGRCYLEPLTK